MKKLKLIIMSLAIVMAVGSAVATRPCDVCVYSDQYYQSGSAYIPAGVFGSDYYCPAGPGVCTYYKPDPVFQPNTYAPCRSGTYTIIP